MSEEIGQNELDALFKDVTGGGGSKTPPPAGGAPASPGGDDDFDVDAILAQAQKMAGQGPGGAANADKASSHVTNDEMDALLDSIGVLGGAGGGKEIKESDFQGFELGKIETSKPPMDAKASEIEFLRDVSLNVKIELGRAKMYIGDVLGLARGSVVELDKLAGDPLDILVNDRLVAKGEVLVLNDNFCVRITEVLSPQSRKDQEKS